MIKIDNEFIVTATTTEVWEVITQLDRYGEWNSFVSECKSSLIVGEPIIMRVHLFPFPIIQKETIFEYTPGIILNYGVKLPFNILTSSRKHTVKPLEDGNVHYYSQFRLSGLLSPIVELLMSNRLYQGFSLMALEMQAEILRRKN